MVACDPCLKVGRMSEAADAFKLTSQKQGLVAEVDVCREHRATMLAGAQELLRVNRSKIVPEIRKVAMGPHRVLSGQVRWGARHFNAEQWAQAKSEVLGKIPPKPMTIKYAVLEQYFAKRLPNLTRQLMRDALNELLAERQIQRAGIRGKYSRVTG